MDVRAKLLLLLAFDFVVAQTSNLWLIIATFFIAAFYCQQAHPHWNETQTAWWLILALNAILLFPYRWALVHGMDVGTEHVLAPIPFPGFLSHAPFLGIVSLPISVESIAFLLTRTLRNFAIALSFPYTTNPSYIAPGFKGPGLPDWTFPFVFSQMSDVTSGPHLMLNGREALSLIPSVVASSGSLSPLIVPLVIGSSIGAEDIINAMELRCFGVGKRVHGYMNHVATERDVIHITLSLVFFILNYCH